MEKIYDDIKLLDKMITKCNYYKFKINEKCIDNNNSTCEKYKNLMDKFCNKNNFLSN